jgi:phosphoribosylglycinamide formyltransferase 1
MTEKSIVILTGNEKRHQFARMALAMIPGLNVLGSICEGEEQNIRELVVRRAGPGCEQELQFLDERRLAEDDAFANFCTLVPDHSNPYFVSRNDVNSPQTISFIANDLKPELILAYGCSIIKQPLLSLFQRRFLNLHLGLSPYYRGAGTNFWPLVNNEPEYVGATFMHLDSGIDTGEIIHQIRSRIYMNDTAHQIGNRLLVDAIFTYGAIVRCLDRIKMMEQPMCANGKYYQKEDYNSRSIDVISRAFREGMISNYLNNRQKRDRNVKIVTNKIVVKELSVLGYLKRDLLASVKQ